MYCVGGSLKNLFHFKWGVWQMLTSSGGSLNADRGRGKICQNLADVICERSLIVTIRFVSTKNEHLKKERENWVKIYLSYAHIMFVYKIPFRRAPRLALYAIYLCSCIQDTLSSRAALGLPAAAFRPSASREQRYLAYNLCSSAHSPSARATIGYLVYNAWHMAA